MPLRDLSRPRWWLVLTWVRRDQQRRLPGPGGCCRAHGRKACVIGTGSREVSPSQNPQVSKYSLVPVRAGIMKDFFFPLFFFGWMAKLDAHRYRVWTGTNSGYGRPKLPPSNSSPLPVAKMGLAIMEDGALRALVGMPNLSQLWYMSNLGARTLIGGSGNQWVPCRRASQPGWRGAPPACARIQGQQPA